MTARRPDRLAGRLLLRGEPGYEQARTGRIFNGATAGPVPGGGAAGGVRC